MEKSIEKIWNESFIKEESFIAPKINDLYNKKSKSVINKIKRTYEIDNKGLIPMAILVLIGMIAFSEFIIGIYGSFLIICLYFFNKRLLSRFETIDIKLDNLSYLKKYQSIVASIIKSTKKLFMFGLPVAVMSIFILAYFIKEDSFLSNVLLNELTFIEAMGIGLGMTVFMSILCTIVYTISTNLVYGRQLRKLNEIISEMENLKSL
ncbi:hypothetical protein [Tenacibaculum sp. M341]|uniref:hypothetical protein n=1 Tax=Tenacibaculum sp. M341 TaxID=2530339 RepID=UPI001050EDA8|nr:hypothetical protein [Tenacibaculum sp. M341]TCI85174.1 hypothetical protein EYW44_17850 [Tenacibaculum sp. M341]